MNINIPITYGFVHKAFITHGEIIGDFVECRIFGASSLKGHPLLFHCQFNNGAVYYRLPIDAFRSFVPDKEEFKVYLLDELEPWSCSSYDCEVTIYEWLFKQRVECLKLEAFGRYICTFDWYGHGTTAEIAHEHKCLHFIELSNGQFALQPNNYILWHEKSNVKIDGTHKELRPNLAYPCVE